MSFLVSAIVLNYKTPQQTVRCVQALRRQTMADRMEIFVIDNHSEDDSIGVLRNRLSGMPDVHILETPINRGYAGGNALGLGRAQGKYLLIINPDNELTPGSLEVMVHTMEADSAIGILAPKLVHEDGTIRDSCRAFPGISDVLIKRTPLRSLFPDRMRRYLQSDRDPDQPRDIDWAVGACLMIRRDLHEKLGGFDSRFFLFFEDMDLCRRCWIEGKRVRYEPKAVATDRKRRLSEGGVLSLLGKRAGRAHLASAAKYFWKWRGDTQKI